MDVEELLSSKEIAEQIVENAVEEASRLISSGKDVLVMTSRKLIVGNNEASSLKIGSVVATALIDFLQRLEVRPRYIIAKVISASQDYVDTRTHEVLGRNYFLRCGDKRVEYETGSHRRPGRFWRAAVAVR
jgi:hypothetical protein